MIATIMAAMTARMKILQESDKKKAKSENKNTVTMLKRKKVNKNTSRGVGKYMGQNSIDVLNLKE